MSQPQLEWTLNPKTFRESVHKLGACQSIDFFSSRINFQLHYVSYHPDPGAIAVNALHMSWKYQMSYAFPPFCLLPRALQEIQQEGSTGLIVMPKWPTQIWWPELMRMVASSPILLPNTKNTLYLPKSPEILHPLYPQLELILCHLLGDSSLARDFRRKLLKSSPSPGVMELLNSTDPFSKHGNYSVVERTLIPFIHLSKRA